MKSSWKFKVFPFLAMVTLAFAVAACRGEPQSDGDGTGESSMAAEGREGAESNEASEHGSEGRESGDSREGGEGEGEHSEGREGGEHGGEEGGHDEGGEEGEEPGIYVDRGETWDMVRRGARLVLAYSAERGAFVGRVENTTDQRLCAVRVEVHLGGGPELGPTAPTDVLAGETIEVELASEGASFETWTAHPELSACSGA